MKTCFVVEVVETENLVLFFNKQKPQRNKKMKCNDLITHPPKKTPKQTK